MDEDGVRTPTPRSVKIRFASRAETIKTPAAFRGAQTPLSGRPVSQGSVTGINSPAVPLDTPTPRSVESQDTARSFLADVAIPLSPEPPDDFGAHHPSFISKVDLGRSVENFGARPPSCTSIGFRQTPPTPKQAWLTRTEATPVTTYDLNGNPNNLVPNSPYLPIPEPDLEALRMYQPFADTEEMHRTVYSPAPSTASKKRAQSATIRRDTPASPQRPVQSARSYGYGGHRSQQSVSKPPTPPVRPPSSTLAIL